MLFLGHPAQMVRVSHTVSLQLDEVGRGGCTAHLGWGQSQVAGLTLAMAGVGSVCTVMRLSCSLGCPKPASLEAPGPKPWGSVRGGGAVSGPSSLSLHGGAWPCRDTEGSTLSSYSAPPGELFSSGAAEGVPGEGRIPSKVRNAASLALGAQPWDMGAMWPWTLLHPHTPGLAHTQPHWFSIIYFHAEV